MFAHGFKGIHLAHLMSHQQKSRLLGEFTPMFRKATKIGIRVSPLLPIAVIVWAASSLPTGVMVAGGIGLTFAVFETETPAISKCSTDSNFRTFHRLMACRRRGIAVGGFDALQVTNKNVLQTARAIRPAGAGAAVGRDQEVGGGDCLWTCV